MKLFKKTTIFIIILCLTFVMFLNIPKKNASAFFRLNFDHNDKLINIGVSLFKSDDPYTSMVKESLERIESENKDKVKFTFFDNKNNEAVQNETLNELLNSYNYYDLLLVNLVYEKEPLMEEIVNKAKQNDKPVIFFNVVPSSLPSSIKNYGKTAIIGTNSKQSGILEGKIIVDIWNNNKKSIDKNNNNILEYVMLQGKMDRESLDRTKYSISTINEAGIQTKELALKINEWDKELAKNNVDALLSRFGDNIEAIIANNDAMAIGAIEALQKYGYNKGNSSKNIAVVGIDGLPEAKKLVDSGIMSGTVIQDPNELANALYTVGMNLVYNMPPLKGTNYKFNQTGPIVELPYYEYTKSK